MENGFANFHIAVHTCIILEIEGIDMADPPLGASCLIAGTTS